MKKIIIILFLSLYSNVFSQRLEEVSDAVNGSKIRYNKLTKDNVIIYINEWSVDCNKTKNEYYHLTDGYKKS